MVVKVGVRLVVRGVVFFGIGVRVVFYDVMEVVGIIIFV